MRIAIDGPSGAGKSTLARELAGQLGLIYVDTGAMYRTVGLYVRRNDTDPSDGAAVEKILGGAKIELRYLDDGQHIFLGDEDVSSAIRTPEASMYASAVAKLPVVRAFLLGLQRDMVERGNVIMDGRDIGTVIMPDADCKMFVFASPEARARRRFKELSEKGEKCTLDEVLADIIKRDENDKNREVAPAIPADDAVMLDNSDLDFEGTVDAALAIIRDKTK